MTRRAILRTAARTLASTVAATVVLPLVLAASASPALALNRDDGDDPGTQLGTLGWLGLYVLVPIALFLAIALLVYAPSLARGPRYRPGVSSWTSPVWFDGPAQGAGAAASGHDGGATAVDALDTEPGVAGGTGRDVVTTGGGASARW